MKVELSEAQEKYVQEKLATGKYASAADVLQEAFRVLQNVEKALPSAQDDLRRELQLGLDDIEEGNVSEWNVDAMKARLLEKLKSKKAS